MCFAFPYRPQDFSDVLIYKTLDWKRATVNLASIFLTCMCIVLFYYSQLFPCRLLLRLEVVAVDAVVLPLRFCHLLLQPNVLGEIPHGSRSPSTTADVLCSLFSHSWSIVGYGTQPCQVQAFHICLIKTWEGNRRSLVLIIIYLNKLQRLAAQTQTVRHL